MNAALSNHAEGGPFSSEINDFVAKMQRMDAEGPMALQRATGAFPGVLSFAAL